jgi:hypothetical protein
MPKEIEKTAYHEAGHAACYIILGKRFKYVTIESAEDDFSKSAGHLMRVIEHTGERLEMEVYNGTPRARRWIEARAMTYAAGNIAECYFAKRRIVAGAASDFSNLVNEISDLCSSDDEVSAYWNWLTIRTRNLLLNPENWLLVDAIAKALLERRKLTYREAKLIAGQARERVLAMSHDEINRMWDESQAFIEGRRLNGKPKAVTDEKPTKKAPKKSAKK